jgi:hypothetical protein
VSQHPVFVLVDLKLRDLEQALQHMNDVQAHQETLKTNHPALYNETVHAQALATNLQAIYTKVEGLLGDMIKEIDGDLPRTESWHKDLLLLCAAPNAPRPAILSRATYDDLTELLGFRHVVRSRYASELRPADVFKNVGTARRALAPGSSTGNPCCARCAGC